MTASSRRRAAIGAAIIAACSCSVSRSASTTATALAYPMGDLILVGPIMGTIALRGWRMDRGWAILGLAFLLLSTADFLYALQTTTSAGRPAR